MSNNDFLLRWKWGRFYWQMTSREATGNQSSHLRTGLPLQTQCQRRPRKQDLLMCPVETDRSPSVPTQPQPYCLPIRCLNINLQRCHATASRIDAWRRCVQTSSVDMKLIISLHKHLLSMWNMHNAGLRAGDAKKNKIHLIWAHRTLPSSLGLQGDPTNPS